MAFCLQMIVLISNLHFLSVSFGSKPTKIGLIAGWLDIIPHGIPDFVFGIQRALVRRFAKEIVGYGVKWVKKKDFSLCCRKISWLWAAIYVVVVKETLWKGEERRPFVHYLIPRHLSCLSLGVA